MKEQEVKVDSYQGLILEGAAIILKGIDTHLADIVKADKIPQQIKDTYKNTAGMTFVEKQLRNDAKAVKFQRGAEEVVLVHPVDTGFLFKEAVDNNIDTKDIKAFLSTNSDAKQYNLNDVDMEDIVTKSKSKARSVVKQCCDIYSKWLHEEYMMKYQIHVDTIFTTQEFGIVGYYSTDAAMQPDKTILCNTDRLNLLSQRNSKKLQDVAIVSKKISSTYNCYIGTQYENEANIAMKPIVDILTAHGEDLRELAKTTRMVKAKINQPLILESVPKKVQEEGEQDSE